MNVLLLNPPSPKGFIHSGRKKGSIPWNKGLTKETDERVRHQEEKITQTKKLNPSKSFLGHNFDHGRGDICKKCGKIHNSPKVRGKTHGGLGHSYDHGKNEPCKLCGKIHITGFRGHNVDHGRGDICKKCGKIHKAGHFGKKDGWSRGLTKETNEILHQNSKKIQICKLEMWRKQRDKMIKAMHFSRDRRPNKFENAFLIYCQNIGFKKVKYVGDGSFWVSIPEKFKMYGQAINPDFIVLPFSKTRTVIETAGVHWHSKENNSLRLSIYDEAKINCILITDEEFYNFPKIVEDKLKPLMRIAL